MNKIYKVVWSKVKNCYVVVSELAKNIITGGVKSAKIGNAPMTKGLALGAMMAFVITGNAWAESVDVNSVQTSKSPASADDKVLTAGGDVSSLNGANNPTWIRPAHMGSATVSGYDSIVFEGSTLELDLGYYESVFYTNGAGASLTVSEIGTIESKIDEDENKAVLFFNAQGGVMDVNATTINVENVNSAVRAEVSGAREGASVEINATDIKLSGKRGIEAYDKAFNDDGSVNENSGTANIDINATNRLEVISTGDYAILGRNDANHQINVDGKEVFIKGGSYSAVYAYDGSQISIGKESEKVDIEGAVWSYSQNFDSKIDIDLGTEGSLTGEVVAYTDKDTINLDLGDSSIWNVTGDSYVSSLSGNNGVVSVDLNEVDEVAIYSNTSTGTTVKARGTNLSGGAKEALAGIGEQLESKFYVSGNEVTFADATTNAQLYGDVELKEGKVITTMDTDDLVVAGKVTAGKLVSTNGMSVATEDGKGKFTVGAITDENGQDNTMMYVYDSEQGKLLYGVNAATGDIMTAGGLAVEGGATIGGGLKVAKGISVADGKIDLAENGVVTAAKFKATNGMSIATEEGKGKFTVGAITDENGQDNTMMYVYDSEQGKLLYGVNAATGDIMTAGGLSVEGGATIGGGLNVAKGISVANGKIDLAENGVVTAAKFKATNGMSIATEDGKGKFTVSEVDGNTMMYVYDSEQGKLLYGVNAATGDVMTAGGLDVAGGANVGGSLNVAKGISVADGKIDLAENGVVTAAKFKATNGMSIATETGKGKFTVGAITDENGQDNTMMYVYDGEQGKLLYGVNAATGDIMTAGGLDVAGGANVGGSLNVAKGISVADGKIDLAENGVVTAAKFKATNGMSIATEDGKGKFTVSEVDGNTMMYVYDSEQGKLLYGVNAATGDVMTAGGLDVAGGANVGGGLNVAKGISIADGKIDLAENGVVTAAKFKATNGMSIATEDGKGKFTVSEVDGNTMMYVYDSEQGKLLYGVNAATGDVMTAGGIDVGGAVVVKGGLQAAGGKFEVDEATGNTKVGGALSVAGGAFGVDENGNVTGGKYNGVDVKATAEQVATNTEAIAQNKADIAANAADIAQNKADIATNASKIQANTDAIEANKTAIEKNASDIAINAEAIAQNKADIAANAADIAQNKADIATNAADIAQNKVDIAANADAIAKETAERKTDIANVTNHINDVAKSVDDLNTAVEGVAADATAHINRVQEDLSSAIVQNIKDINAVEKGLDEESKAREEGDKKNAEAIEANANAIANNSESISGLNQRLGKMNGKINKVGAGAAALAALHPLEYDPDDKLTFSAGVGNYNGENAAALGAFYRPDEKLMFSLGGTMGNGENMVNLGVSIGLDGAKGGAKLSKKELIQKVSTMEAENAAIKAENDALEDRVAKLEALVAKLAEK